MAHLRNALIAALLLAGMSPVIAQQFPTVPDHTVIGRIGTGTGSGPSQAVPFGSLFGNIGGISVVVFPPTGKLEGVVPVQTNKANGAACTSSCGFTSSDFFMRTRRSNSASAMTDTLPAAGSSGLINGTRIEIVNVDASANDTITAGSGTTIVGGATFVLGPSRDLMLTYDLANTAWRSEANSALALIGPNNLSDLSSASTARTNLGLGALATVTPGTGIATALGVNVGSAGAPVLFNGAGGTPTSLTLTNATGLPYTALPALSANQVLGALTGTTPSGQSVPSCSTSASALLWTSGSGFSCNSAINAATLGGATFASPGTIGGSTPAAATFTTLTVNTSITGAAFGTNVATALATATGSASGFQRIIATGTMALGTSAITSATCGTATTGVATGIASTDHIELTFQGDPTATTGYLPSASVSLIPYQTANTINVKQCNYTGGSITPSALTINWVVLR